MQLIRFLLSISRARIVTIFAAGLVSGVANTYLLVLIKNVLSAEAHHGRPSIVAFAVTAMVALASSVVSQLLLIRLIQDAIYQLRAQLSSSIVSAPLERLERLGGHRLLATLTEDVRTLSHAVTALPNLCVDVVTIVGCLTFLAVVCRPVFAVTAAGTAVSILVVQASLLKVRRLYRDAREKEDTLVRSFQSVTSGIKELKLHRERRRDFMNRHLLESADAMRTQNVTAGWRLSFARSYGRMFQLLTMAVVLFVLAAALDLPHSVIVAYVLVTIFLTRPLQTFVQRILDLLRGDVALANIRAMSLSMGTAADEPQLPYVDRPAAPEARLELTNVSYTYQGESGPHGPKGSKLLVKGPPTGVPQRRHPAGGRKTDRRLPPGRRGDGSGFRLGPLDVVFEPGEITFIVGGNGTGKSTLAKLLTGLYVPQSGFVTLNGEEIGNDNIEWLRQNCSAVFTDFHLFEDFLGFDRPGIDDEVRKYLTELQLAHKVTVENGRLSTVALSQGQQKRLALLNVLLEDRPICVFDEWAADQEPRFREVFYTEILIGLARRGKTVVVITHDDRYFHCADRIVKLDFGQIVGESEQFAATAAIGQE